MRCEKVGEPHKLNPVGRWTAEADKLLGSPERKERCARCQGKNVPSPPMAAAAK